MQNFIVLSIAILLVSTITTSLFTPLVKKIAKKLNIMDHPTSRKIHANPVPLLGGVAIVIGFFVSVISHHPFDPTVKAIFIGGCLALILGIIDDIWSPRPIYKLSGQIFIGVMTYYSGISIQFLTNPFNNGVFYLEWISLPLTVFWIVAIMNTINLMDGIDGLAAGIVAISAFFLCLVAVGTGQLLAAILALATLGSCIGFLRFNFEPARIFMGDSGTMFLGYMLSIISMIGVLKSTIAISLTVPMIVLGIPIADTMFTIIRRLKRKKSISLPDKEHVHHKLIELGLTHKQTALILYTGSIVLGLMALFMSHLSNGKAIIVLLITLVVSGLVIKLSKSLMDKHQTIFKGK